MAETKELRAIPAEARGFIGEGGALGTANKRSQLSEHAERLGPDAVLFASPGQSMKTVGNFRRFERAGDERMKLTSEIVSTRSATAKGAVVKTQTVKVWASEAAIGKSEAAQRRGGGIVALAEHHQSVRCTHEAAGQVY